jgi:hypothetical protein
MRPGRAIAEGPAKPRRRPRPLPRDAQRRAAEWSDVANDWVRKHTDINLDDWPFRVYVVPGGEVCGWGGMGYVGCYDDCRAWIHGDLWDVSHRGGAAPLRPGRRRLVAGPTPGGAWPTARAGLKGGSVGRAQSMGCPCCV